MTTIRSPMRTPGSLLAALCAVCLASPLPAQTVTPAPSSAPAKATAHTARAANKSSNKDLDLQAPPLSHIYPSRQLQYILAPESEDVQETGVSVRAEKYVVTVPGGPGNQLVAIPWALLHPTQAWRIFTPLESP